MFHLGDIHGPSWPKHLQAEQLATHSASESNLCLQGKQIIKTDQRLVVIIRSTLIAVQSLLRISYPKDGEEAAGTVLKLSSPPAPPFGFTLIFLPRGLDVSACHVCNQRIGPLPSQPMGLLYPL